METIVILSVVFGVIGILIFLGCRSQQAPLDKKTPKCMHCGGRSWKGLRHDRIQCRHCAWVYRVSVRHIPVK